MTWEAVCTDCGWECRDENREVVTEAVERHARKEHHHVELTRPHAVSP